MRSAFEPAMQHAQHARRNVGEGAPQQVGIRILILHQLIARHALQIIPVIAHVIFAEQHRQVLQVGQAARLTRAGEEPFQPQAIAQKAKFGRLLAHPGIDAQCPVDHFPDRP